MKDETLNPNTRNLKTPFRATLNHQTLYPNTGNLKTPFRATPNHER